MNKKLLKNSIDKIADVIRKYSNSKIPIDIMEVAKMMGLNIFQSDFSDESISGLIIPKDKEIHVAKKDNYERKRFSIAHEIGHYVLHYNFGKDIENKEHVSYRNSDSSLGFSIKEIEANHFAAALLMPEDELKKIWKEEKDLENVARIMEVSIMALSIRLDYLGLL